MAEDSPLYWPIAALKAAYRDRLLTPVEVTHEALERIERFDCDLHAFLTIAPELTLAQAEAAERAYRERREGVLLGVPISIKDAFYVRGMETTLGSLVHRGQVALADSGVVRRLRAAGAVFTGKTNTPEFGQSATTDNLLGPPTRNPWDLDRTPGGSSGGAAASVAAGLSTAAIGSDGGGSIRIPAAFTGVFGFKPTAGACPDENGFRAMTEFVSPGPLASCVADARAVLDVLRDRHRARVPVTKPLRVGWCARPEGRPVTLEVAETAAQAISVLEQLGHRVITLDPPIGGWSEISRPWFSLRSTASAATCSS